MKITQLTQRRWDSSCEAVIGEIQRLKSRKSTELRWNRAGDIVVLQ